MIIKSVKGIWVMLVLEFFCFSGERCTLFGYHEGDVGWS